jgi:hypothetical protein
MQTKFARQTWTFDPNYTRVEALDAEGQPLGYVYFVPRTHRRTSHTAESSLLSVFPETCRQLLVSWFGRSLAA